MSPEPPVVRYRLPDDLRERMRDPFGGILSEADLLDRIQDGALRPPFVAVGDVVADTLLRHGITPHLMVYDLITKRDAIGDAMKARLRAHEARHVLVRSEPATLSEELMAAMAAALQEDAPVKIQVEGEEDLATLPALAYTPLGGTVLYGMPNRGVVAVPVTPEARQRAVDWLSLMKVGDDAPGAASH